MRFAGRLTLPQRIVIVVALAAACASVGAYVASLGGGQVAFGWYAYAPLTSGSPLSGSGSGLAEWQRLLIWLALTVGWALVSLWVLRPAPRRPAQD
jgi:heme/copper-type cytochrome/quinol oxidase subunit 1